MSAEAANPEPKGSGMLPIAGIALVTILLGASVGVFLVGPMLAGDAAGAAAPEHGEAAAEASGEHGGGGGHGGADAAEHYSIENLVVNPAGTQGSRFLIVSLTLVPDDAETRAQLTSRDAEIRDTLIQVLAAKTVQELSDLTQRESMKEEMRAAAESVVKPGRIRRIFLPQFVLQ